MNTHRITKSLFVGAAIAGIGMSSGKAEIVIGNDVRQQLQNVTRKMLQSHRLEVNEFHEEHKTLGSFNYSDEMIEEDVKRICDALYERNSGIPVFSDVFTKHGNRHTNTRKSYVQLLNAALNSDSNETIDWFFRKDALEVFLRYHMFDVCPGSRENFEKKWGAFYFGAGGLSKYSTIFETEHFTHIAVPFTCRDLMKKFILAYQPTARDTQGLWSKRWSEVCKEHKGLKYFREGWLDWQFYNHVTNATIYSHLAKVIFSKEYAAKIKEILYGEIFRGLKKDRNLQMRFLKGMCNTNSEKEICRFVAACFHQYKKIKKAIDTDSVTLDTENMYERFLDVECRLGNKDNNKNAPLTRNNATEFSELIGNPVFLYMHDFLESMKADIANVPELVNKLFTDPVYWAPAPVSDKEGADSLKELEENDAKKGKDAPNAFLEEID